MDKDTEYIDKLFLELSQFTNAKTKREKLLEDAIKSAIFMAKQKESYRKIINTLLIGFK